MNKKLRIKIGILYFDLFSDFDLFKKLIHDIFFADVEITACCYFVLKREGEAGRAVTAPRIPLITIELVIANDGVFLMINDAVTSQSLRKGSQRNTKSPQKKPQARQRHPWEARGTRDTQTNTFLEHTLVLYFLFCAIDTPGHFRHAFGRFYIFHQYLVITSWIHLAIIAVMVGDSGNCN